MVRHHRHDGVYTYRHTGGLGHIEEILQVNRHEGVHLGLPLRTNEKFSKTVSLEASVGYGFRDRSVKGMGRVSVNLPTPRKNILQLEYHDRYVWSEVDDMDRLLRENSMVGATWTSRRMPSRPYGATRYVSALRCASANCRRTGSPTGHPT